MVAVDYKATWDTFQPIKIKTKTKKDKFKKNNKKHSEGTFYIFPEKNFLIFGEFELYHHKLKKLLYLFLKTIF